MCCQSPINLLFISTILCAEHIFFAATYYKRCSAEHLLYLVAILDVASRKVLSFRVSNTMTPDFCVDALTEAIARYGAPEIVNTDQGSQFTSKAWTDVVDAAGARISMDGKGRWIDNVFIERLWRSVKYEDIYLRAYESGRALQAGLTRYFDVSGNQVALFPPG